MRILFVKTSSLGDVLHHCPAVSDARYRFPEAAIDWVVEESFAGIAEMHPAVRRVVPVAIRRWRRRIASPSAWMELREFRRALRSESYDCVIDTQGLLKSALIASQARGTTHGFDASSAREPLASRFYDFSHRILREMHAVERNRTLTAMALGIEQASICDYGLRAPHGVPVPVPSRYCVMLSMTSRADKLWPEPHWVELTRVLSAAGLVSVYPWGNASEQARCRRIVEAAGSGVVPRAMSLGELASVISASQVVIGVDTGLSHLAAALRVPVVGLYCGSEPRLTGLYGSGKFRNLGRPGETPSVGDAASAIEAFA